MTDKEVVTYCCQLCDRDCLEGYTICEYHMQQRRDNIRSGGDNISGYEWVEEMEEGLQKRTIGNQDDWCRYEKSFFLRHGIKNE